MYTIWLKTLGPRWNEQHFADDISKRIFFNENVWISITISPKFVPKGPINNIPALGQIMAWHRPGDKPLSEPMMVSLPTHICVTQPQWVKSLTSERCGTTSQRILFRHLVKCSSFATRCDITLKWKLRRLTNEKSSLVMIYCRQGISHYLSQSRPRSISPYGVSRPQWV